MIVTYCVTALLSTRRMLYGNSPSIRFLFFHRTKRHFTTGVGTASLFIGPVGAFPIEASFAPVLSC